MDAWGKSGDAVRAQEVFDAALAAGLADEIADLALLRALQSNSAPRDALTRAVESLLSRRQLEQISATVATTVAWAAARLGRLDWMRGLPPGVCTGRPLFTFALHVEPSDGALAFLQSFGAVSLAGIIALRFRLLGPAGSIAELKSLARDCHDLVESATELDSFSRVRITETEVRCLRRCGAIEEAIASWAKVDDLPVGNRETRASLLAESGRDLLIGGLRHGEVAQCVRGARRLTQGWSVARLSNLNDLEVLRTASEALGGYADARVEMATASPELVAMVRPILAEGARDGRWAVDAVRTSDLPDFYKTPALAGMEFLAELKLTLQPQTRSLYVM